MPALGSAATVARRRARAVLDDVLREGTVVARSNGSVHSVFPVAIPADESEALRELARREFASRTIEVGLGYGISALSICAAILERAGTAPRHVVIDPYQATRFGGCGLQLLDDAGCREFVEYYDDESQVVLPRLLARGRVFDLAFVDGNHRFDGVFVDLVYLARLLRPGSTIFLDDYQLPAVRRATSFFVNNRGWAVEHVSPAHNAHQWAVVRSANAPDDRPFDHFVEF